MDLADFPRDSVRWRSPSRERVEKVIGRSSWNCVLICNEYDRTFKPNSLVIDDVGEVWLHDDVAVGGVGNHLHRGSGVGVDEDLLPEVEACLAAVLASLRPDTLQRHCGEDWSSS